MTDDIKLATPIHLQFRYTNYHGETKFYNAVAHSIFYGKNPPYENDSGFFMRCTDLDRNVERCFLIGKMFAVRPFSDAPEIQQPILEKK